jgi:hypothetical protein
LTYVYSHQKTTIFGYLVRRRRDELVVKNASVVFKGQMGGEKPLAGEVHLERAQGDFYVVIT